MREWTHNVPGIQAGLAEVADAAADVSPAWKRLSTWYTGTARATFASNRWRPLSTKYARWKDKHHPGQGMLRLTGALYSAVTEPQIEELGRDEALIGINTGPGDLYYGGIVNKRRRILPRLPRSEIDELENEIAEHILDAGAGGRR